MKIFNAFFKKFFWYFFITQDARVCCVNIEAMKKRTRKVAEDIPSNCLHWDVELGMVL